MLRPFPPELVDVCARYLLALRRNQCARRPCADALELEAVVLELAAEHIDPRESRDCERVCARVWRARRVASRALRSSVAKHVALTVLGRHRHIHDLYREVNREGEPR